MDCFLSLNENCYMTANFITTFFESIFKKLRNYFDIESYSVITKNNSSYICAGWQEREEKIIIPD